MAAVAHPKRKVRARSAPHATIHAAAPHLSRSQSTSFFSAGPNSKRKEVQHGGCSTEVKAQSCTQKDPVQRCDSSNLELAMDIESASDSASLPSSTSRSSSGSPLLSPKLADSSSKGVSGLLFESWKSDLQSPAIASGSSPLLLDPETPITSGSHAALRQAGKPRRLLLSRRGESGSKAVGKGGISASLPLLHTPGIPLSTGSTAKSIDNVKAPSQNTSGKKARAGSETAGRSGVRRRRAHAKSCPMLGEDALHFVPFPKICPQPNLLQDSKRSRPLRVAILDAGKRLVHPAAHSCMVALAFTPWFLSEALVAIFDENGTQSCRVNVGPDHLSLNSPFEVDLVKGHNIQEGCLCADPIYDVLVVPGGSAVQYAKLLGEDGYEAVRNFVAQGGGYCGICAGAFIALCGWKHRSCKSLGIVNAGLAREGLKRKKRATCLSVPDPGADKKPGSTTDPTVPVQNDVRSSSKDKDERRRKRAAFHVDLRFSKEGRSWLWDEGKARKLESEELENGAVKTRYHNGPLMVVKKNSAACILATMWPVAESTRRSGLADLEARQMLPGVVGAVAQDFGGGRAVLLSPHTESTHQDNLGTDPSKPRLRRILQRAVLLAASGSGAMHPLLQDVCNVPAQRRR